MGKDRNSGALLLIISTLMVKILGVLYKVPLSYILNEEGMGYFNTAYTLYGFFYILCSTGIPKAVTMQVSGQLGIEKSKLFLIYNKGFVIISLIVFVLFVLLAKPLSLLLGIEGVFYSLISISPAVFFASVSSLYRGYLIGIGKVGGIAIASLVEGVSKFLFGLLFALVAAKLGLDIYYISMLTVLGISIGGFLSTLIMYICCKSSIKKDNKGQNSIFSLKDGVNDLIKIALPITVSSLAINLGGLLDLPILVSSLSTYMPNESEIVALYGNYSTLGLPMFNLIVSVTAPLCVTLLPKLCLANKEGDRYRFNQLLKNTTKISLILTSCAVAIFYYFSFDILDLLFSTTGSVNGYLTLSFLSLSLLFYVPLSICNTVHESTRRLFVPIASLLLGSVVKLVLGYILCSSTTLSVSGLAVANIISYGISLLVSILFLSEKKAFLTGLLQSSIYILLGFLVYGFFFEYVYKAGILGQSTLSFIILICLSSLCYLLLVTGFEYLMNKKTTNRQNIQKNQVYN